VDASSRLLADHAEHLTFVSSIAAHAGLAASGIGEDAPLSTAGESYGALKSACERAATAAFACTPASWFAPAPWSQLPLWIPAAAGDRAGFFHVDGARAFAARLRARPLADTARDTRAALLRDGEPQPSGRTIRQPGPERAIQERAHRRPLTMRSTSPYSTASLGVM
jgi:hypothetical protein